MELDAIADLLLRPRELLADAVDAHDSKPSSGSVAAGDAASEEFDYANLNAIQTAPNSVASLLIRVASDYISGLGALFRAREITGVPAGVTRGALEHGVRAMMLLDPTVDLRARLARTLLHDLASARFAKATLVQLGLENESEGVDAIERCNGAHERLLAVFPDAKLKGRSDAWEAGGERFLSFTAATRKWCELRGDNTPGAGVYSALSLGTHPQTFLGNLELAADENGVPVLRSTPDLLRRYAGAAIAPWVDATRLMLSYNGWDESELDAFLADWHAQIDGT
jgi:hypothetical protein